jgi:hypothetical protein
VTLPAGQSHRDLKSGEHRCNAVATKKKAGLDVHVVNDDGVQDLGVDLGLGVT